MTATAKAWSHFDDTSFEAVHGRLLDLLPPRGSAILDVGAGTGRDARALASRGYVVTAVEPSAVLLAEGQSRRGPGVEWIADELPDLRALSGRRFDLIIASAVWMFVPEQSREASLRRLSDLLAPRGFIILSTRARLASDDRDAFWELNEETLLAATKLASLELVRTLQERDSLGRPIEWHTYVLAHR